MNCLEIFKEREKIKESELEIYLADNGYDIWQDTNADAIDSTKVIEIAIENGFKIEDEDTDEEFIFIKYMPYIDKIINAATDEIYDTVMFVLDQTKTCGTGNHFINDNYNISVDTGTDWSDDNTVRERIYYCIKLEQYENDECINDEVDYEDTSTLSKEDLRLGIERIIKSNIEEITGGK